MGFSDSFGRIWVWLAIFTIVPFIIGIVGAGLYGKKVVDTHHYKPSTCLVDSSDVVTKTCSRQSCSGTTSNKHCTTRYYNCYQAHWVVILISKYNLIIQVKYTPNGETTEERAQITDTWTYDYYSNAWDSMNEYQDGTYLPEPV